MKNCPGRIQKTTAWGNYPKVKSYVSEASFDGQLADCIAESSDLIAQGNARSYGDSALSGHIISMLKMDKLLDFNPQEKTMEAQAGILLSDILGFIVPRGFFLPVTPGTRFITLGGALAADVHGKNHHVGGCFSDHVVSFRLMGHEGRIHQCSRDENSGLFYATCGAMGLTGIILSVKFRLMAIETTYIRQTSLKARNLEEILHRFDQTAGSTYSVAWIDMLAHGRSLGRSALMHGDHAPLSELKKQGDALQYHPKEKFSIPRMFPGWALNRLSVKAFNAFYYHKQWKKESTGLAHLEPFFYPLDAIGHWNRLYGRGGFTQYQFVVPKQNGHDALKAILERIARSRQGSFLAVLKLMGPENKLAPLSFPLEGYILAVDIKISPKLFPLLRELDELVIRYGGRLYLCKDVRMSEEVFKASYPGWQAFKEGYVSGKFRSLQSVRIGLT